MTEDEFAKLTLADKWSHVAEVMDYILKMDTAYDLRRRFNPHHQEKMVKEERRNLRADQHQRWAHIKGLYSNHRDEMTNTLENEKFAEYKNILETVFTAEVDDALRDIIGDE
jgi:hypothetical protein